eukprot:CAMPEP_0173448078 /NCGR_PEP_ID=MMETSP1357-20121228/40056_1 /TAXON_ID=77926 /ORGANISM="Hemiselmis rufescens, Strain PCC563" /LENGTH=91 /DNA_ID=CAMNT_0014414545 /DNA_START=237 /DNA_END=512 /DNA_ORIENTATION=+
MHVSHPQLAVEIGPNGVDVAILRPHHRVRAPGSDACGDNLCYRARGDREDGQRGGPLEIGGTVDNTIPELELPVAVQPPREHPPEPGVGGL